ncbi:MAG TPA: hypothetical protein VKG78_10320 [Opitutaceae bacterium]|nr:hypothetical protein [Opitutaceae bacterium]
MSAGGHMAGPTSGELRQIALITAVAALLFIGVRALPTGTNLSHMDFRVRGGSSIEFCDPANPQFLPVVAVRSPVSLAVTTAGPPRAGLEVMATLVITTFSGKPVAPEDLEVVQTKRIHLLIVDPSLDDYQHVHPRPGRRAGEWQFGFRPRFGGGYRLFADFTPVATGRGLYSEAEVEVAGPPNPAAAGSQALSWTATEAGCRFALSPGAAPIRAGVPADLRLVITDADGGPVPLGPLMGAYAHLVAFDTQRSGFAHIHPKESDVTRPPDPRRPAFSFRLMIPRPGRYVIWSEVNLSGRDTFAPFWFDVGP